MQAAVFAQEGPTAGALLRTTFALARRNLGPFAAIAAVGVAPLVLLLISGVTITDPSQLGLALVLMFTFFTAFCISLPIAYGAIMVAVYQAAMGRAVDVPHCLRTSVRRLPRMILAGVLYAFSILLGFLLFVIPGIIATYVFMLAVPVVMLEDRGPIEAMKRSRHLTEGFRLSAFGATIALTLLSFAGAMLCLVFVKYTVLYMVLYAILNVLSSVLSFVLVGVLYFGVRSYKESLGADEVAAVFD